MEMQVTWARTGKRRAGVVSSANESREDDGDEATVHLSGPPMYEQLEIGLLR